MNVSDIRALLQGADDRWLFREADAIRRKVFKTDVYLRGVIEFSNWCVNSCLYCGLRRPHRGVQRYRMKPAEIVQTASLAPRLGVGTVVLQSGDDFHYRKDALGKVIHEIKEQSQVALTLSLGDRTEEELRYWRDAAADRYLLKIETFHTELFESMRPGLRIHDRLSRIELLRKLGYEVGSGIITDLPGMTVDILAEDIVRLARLDLDMIAAGPFVPHPDTPLAEARVGTVMHAFRTVALIRLTNPRANIPATSALSSVDESALWKALSYGANVLMPAITPEEVRGHYSIYPGKNTATSSVFDHIEYCKAMIRETGIPSVSRQGFCTTEEP